MDDDNSDFPEDPEDDKPTYKVGYKKPPKNTQFQNGQSGNRKGRPKGARNKPKDLPTNILNELIIKEGMREITIQEGSKRRKISIVEATIKSLSMKAIKGDHRSHKLLLKLYGLAEKSETDLKQEFFETAVLSKINGLKELETAKEQNLPEPDIIPHPHHIKIDVRAGTADIIGPITPDEKKEWDMWVARKLGWLAEIEEMEHILETGIEPFDGSLLAKPGREALIHDIEHLEELVDIARKQIPDDYYIPPSTMEFVKTKPDIYEF